MSKRIIAPWENCPNCDAPLLERIFVGDDWECAACGESGTRDEAKRSTAPLVNPWPESETGEIAQVEYEEQSEIVVIRAQLDALRAEVEELRVLAREAEQTYRQVRSFALHLGRFDCLRLLKLLPYNGIERIEAALKKKIV